MAFERQLYAGGQRGAHETLLLADAGQATDALGATPLVEATALEGGGDLDAALAADHAGLGPVAAGPVARAVRVVRQVVGHVVDARRPLVQDDLVEQIDEILDDAELDIGVSARLEGGLKSSWWS